MTFDQLELHPQILKAISLCGYNTPTPIQAKSIPEILRGSDVLASAQTGSGKTASFVLPALHTLTEKKLGNTPRVLILTPTRELATQITQAASQYGKFLRFNIVSLVGGMPYRQQLRNLSRAVDIIVATPGRLMDHMENNRLDLSNIEMLILDEADRMLDMGFIDDVTFIANATPKNRQTLLFSATVDNRLMQVIKQIQKDPVRIDLSNERIAPSKITQELYMADNQLHKSRLLMHFLKEQNIFKAIIFSATKVNADDLAAELCEQGFEAAPLHGDLKQNARNKTIERLRKGTIQFLVATDVAARGIDIDDVTHVFNYDLPKFSEDYVHRIGRTGRAGKSGTAISLATVHDLRHISRIERLLKQTLERKVIPGLEPTQSSGKANGKKKSRNTSAHGEKKFGRKKSFARDETKKFGGKDSAPRKEKRFDDRPAFDRSEKSNVRGKMKFGDRDFSARDERTGEHKKSPARDKRKFGEKDFSARGDRKFGDRDSFARGERKTGNKERDFSSRGDRKFGDRDSFARGERKTGNKERDFSSRGDRKFGDRDSFARGERKTGNKERDLSSRSDRKFGDRDSFARGERKTGNKERDFSSRGDRKFGDRDSFARGEKKTGNKERDFSSRGDRKFGSRDSFARGEKKVGGQEILKRRSDRKSSDAGKPAKRFVAESRFGKKSHRERVTG